LRQGEIGKKKKKMREKKVNDPADDLWRTRCWSIADKVKVKLC